MFVVLQDPVNSDSPQKQAIGNAKNLGAFHHEQYNHSNDFIWQSTNDYDGEAKKHLFSLSYLCHGVDLGLVGHLE